MIGAMLEKVNTRSREESFGIMKQYLDTSLVCWELRCRKLAGGYFKRLIERDHGWGQSGGRKTCQRWKPGW